jgi:hypothetical protein
MIGIPAIARALPLVAATLSCGGHTPRGHVCDGSGSLRLAMARLSSFDRLQPGSQVLFENGSPFLYVDGNCRYWVQSDDGWAGSRSGVLTPSQASQLEADTHYADWIRGDWRTPTLADASLDILYDTSVKLSCSSLCGSSSAPDFLKDVTARFADIVRPLSTGGGALQDQRVRISVVQLDPGAYDFVPHAAWPLAVALQGIAQDQGTAQMQGYGHGLLFQGADAEKLRALRATYVAGSYRQLGVPGLPIDDGGQVYLLFVRDVLPFEDASGLVRPSF